MIDPSVTVHPDLAMTTAMIDLELDAALADPVGAARSTINTPRHDQASRLRALLAGEHDWIGPQAGNAEPRTTASNSTRSEGPPTRHESVQSVDGRSDAPSQKPNRQARVISVTSGKGGVGKTSVAVNLSVCFAQRSVRTVLVDADLGTANADILCGVSPSARLDHVVTDLPVHDGARRSLTDIAMPVPGGFRLVPGSAGIARLADLSDHQQRLLLTELSQLEAEADAIVVDTGAGVGRNVIRFVGASDIALLIVTPEPTSITDAYALIKCLHRDLTERHGTWTGVEPFGPRIAVVVNQAADLAEARQVFARLSAVADRFLAVRVFFGGCIAQDMRVGESVRARDPVVLRTPASAASQDLRSLAAFLVRELGCAANPGSSGTSTSAARPSLFRRWFGTRTSGRECAGIGLQASGNVV